MEHLSGQGEQARPLPLPGAWGLLLTDVERQPFRSMGFVSVISVISVTVLLALGLPLVLL